MPNQADGLLLAQGILGVRTWYVTEEAFAAWCMDISTASEVQSGNPAASTIFLSSYCNMVGVEVTSFAYSNKHTVTDSEYPQVQRKLAP